MAARCLCCNAPKSHSKRSLWGHKRPIYGGEVSLRVNQVISGTSSDFRLTPLATGLATLRRPTLSPDPPIGP
jgi:hypothetical protein